MFNSLQGWFRRRRTGGVQNGEPDIDEQTDAMNPTERDHDAKVQQLPLSIDPVIQRKVVRKLDRNLLSLLFVLYLLAFLDRSNIGNARIAGMSDDLHLDVGDRYSWLLTIFYIPYIIFELSIVGWKIFPPHIWLAFLVFGWGAVAACQAATTTWAGMMVCRFLLAAFEAGFGPGTTYFLSFFYLRTEIGFRQGIFLSAAPLATCFAGALAYGITSGHAAIANWRLLFLVEGLPVVFPMAVVSFFFCPDSAHQAWFLSEEEKQVALARGVRQTGSPTRIGGISFKDTLDTLKDAKPWFTALMYFSCNVSFASLPVYLPTILQELGFSGVAAQGLSAPPYFLAFLVTVLTSWLADRTQQRGLTIMIMSIIGGSGYIMLATTTSVAARYAGTFLAASGVFPCIANILPWVTNNQGSDTRRGIGIIMLNVIGQCGPLLGTRLYPENEQPRYIKGQSVCAAFMFFTTILAFSLRTLLAWENRKLDKKYGTLDAQRERADTAGSSDVAIENYGPMYRYVL